MKLSLALAALISTAAFGSDYYVAATTSGAANGTSCANADVITGTHFTTSGNWVGGLTWHLCGTFTGTGGSTLITTLGGGSSGNPLVIKLEPGVLVQAPYWNVSNGAIHIVNSFVTIDGGGNGTTTSTLGAGTGGGTIQNTLDGTAGNTGCVGGTCNVQQQTSGVQVSSSTTNVIVHDLIVGPLYVRTEDTPTTNDPSGGEDSTSINLAGSSAQALHNTLNYAGGAVAGPGCGQAHTVIAYNAVSFCQHCMTDGAVGVSCTVDDLQIHDNDVGGGAYLWDVSTNDYHHNGIFVFADSSGGANPSVTNLKIYNNYVHGIWSRQASYGGSHTTGLIFIDDSGTGVIQGYQLFNNVLELDSGDLFGTANGNIAQTQSPGSSGNIIANNTIIQFNGDVGICAAMQNQTNLTFENNLFQGCGYAPQFSSSLVTPILDYNLYYQTAAEWSYPGNQFVSFTSWQGAGFDVHGQNGNNPNLSGSFIPQAVSAAIGQGVNLTTLGISLLDEDQLGKARPSSGPWTVGALNQGSSATGGSSTGPGVTTGPGVIKALR